MNRYVDRVVSYLPLLDRRKARAVITSAIYARLDDITGGSRPTAYDLRQVLSEMGRPRMLADAYYNDFHKSLWKKPDLWKSLHRFITVLTIAALILVAIGLAELIMGVGSMSGFITGLSLGVIVVLYQMLISPRVTIAADGR